MKVDDAITYVIKNSPPGLTVDEVYHKMLKLAENDLELFEDWYAKDQETLRKDAKKEATSRKRYIAQESKRKRS